MPAAANKTDLGYLEHNFDYQFNRYGERELKKLTIGEQDRVKERLNDLKQKKWREIVNMPREDGFTPEVANGDSYKKTQGRAGNGHTKIYPFHMRVPSISKKFRVFGYQNKDIFYVTQIDRNHVQHRQ